jgi:hypothetical protein
MEALSLNRSAVDLITFSGLLSAFQISLSLILVDPLGLFDPNTVTKFTSSAQRILMLFLHFSRSNESATFSVLGRQVSKNLENGVSNTV